MLKMITGRNNNAAYAMPQSQYGVEQYNTYVQVTNITSGSAIAEEPRDALRQLKYYGRFLTELLTRSSANPEEPCEHTVI